MRPISKTQDPLANPLNELLATPAYVRIMRVVSTIANIPLTVSQVSALTGLTVRGAQKSLDHLAATGFIIKSGGSRCPVFELRKSNLLTQAIKALFATEQSLYQSFLSDMRTAVQSLLPAPLSVWVSAPPQAIGGIVELNLLHEARYINSASADLRCLITPVEQCYDITIEINAYTKADLSNHKTDYYTHIYGIPPWGPSTKPLALPKSHEGKSRQISQYCKTLSNMILKDSSLIIRAQGHISKLLKGNPNMAMSDISEWGTILNSYSKRRLSQFLISDSQRARRLQQSCPFFAILSQQEVNILQSLSAKLS